MSDLIERLRSVRGSFVIPVECPNVFAWAEEAADALEQKDKRIAELEGVICKVIEDDEEYRRHYRSCTFCENKAKICHEALKT